MDDMVSVNIEDAKLIASALRNIDPTVMDPFYYQKAQELRAHLEDFWKTRQITVICKEVGYTTDPLIYVVEITGRATKEKVTKAVRDQRRHDLPEDCEDVVQTLTPLFAFEGDLEAIADWRRE